MAELIVDNDFARRVVNFAFAGYESDESEVDDSMSDDSDDDSHSEPNSFCAQQPATQAARVPG